MSFNFLIFKKQFPFDAKFSEIIDANKDHQITIISEFPSRREMSIYDPTYRYASSLEQIVEDHYRYFSIKDYKMKTPFYAVRVSEPLQRTDGPNELIFFVSPLSSLYNQGIDRIQNLAHTDQFGEIVFIDGQNKAQLDKVSGYLKNHGYIHATFKQQLPTLIQIGRLVSSKLAGHFYPSLVVNLTYIFFLFFFCYQNTSRIQLMMLFGHSKMHIFYDTFKPLIFSLPVFLFLHQLQYIHYKYFANYIYKNAHAHFTQISLVHTLFMFFMTFFSFMFYMNLNHRSIK